MKRLILLPLIPLLGLSIMAAPFADFEGADFAGWTVEGTAFGTAPAHGRVGGQKEVAGFVGQGFANSFHGGDDATGGLMSPVFKIERKFITFLLGGGAWPNETCLNLRVDGKVVGSSAGTNNNAGGKENLTPMAWDVAEFIGREARLEIVDRRKGNWGHVMVDEIAFTDDRGSIPLVSKAPMVELTRTLRIDADFLQLPLLKRAQKQEPGVAELRIEGEGKLLRFAHLKLAGPNQAPDYHYSYDVRELKGREVTLRFLSADRGALDRLVLDNREIVDPRAYEGPLRPRFHFSPRIGWMNDVNGTYYQDGLYHLFYQANPTTAATSTGFNMHWGHSVSKDLVHWEEWPIAVFPDSTGDCYSGTTVMARHSIPGLTDRAKLPAPVLVVAATRPFSQHLATTNDGGRTWQRYAGNPVVPNMGQGDRDPKVIWHEASQHYVMVLYVGGKGYVFLRSKNLVKWEQTSVLTDWYECPEFIPFKSPTTGEELYLLYGCYSPKGMKIASAYQLGRFDGATFTPVGQPRRAHQGPNFYGALIFVNDPQHRPIMMAWTSGPALPGEPFNQMASVPLLLSLRAIAGQDTLCFEPAAEVNALRGAPLMTLTNVSAADATAKLQSLAKDAPVDIVVRFRPSAQSPVGFRTRGFALSYDPATRTLKRGEHAVVLHPEKAVEARFLIDTSIVESFWNHGEAAYAASSFHTAAGPAFAIEGEATIEELVVYPMKNIWK